jgi:hypothetical protein
MARSRLRRTQGGVRPASARRWPVPWLGLLVVLASASIAIAAGDDGPPAPADHRVTLGFTERPPVIDGVMDDPGWLDGGLVDELTQVLPVPGDAPSQRTEIRIVTDGQTLFVGFRCWDTNPEQIVRNRKQRDTFPFWDDRVGFSLDTFNTKRNGYFFQTNPNAMRHDVLLEAEEFEVSWDTIWYVETSIDEAGWTAEFAIPFASIGFDPFVDAWGINFERGIRRSDETARWSDWQPQNFVSSMGVAGTLEGVEGLDQGLGFELTPGMTIRRRDERAVDDRFEFDPTFDGYYKVLPSVTASVTANTDFGQVEVDDIQIQDDRFALFFPEKRDFFLEDGLIFDFGDISQNGRPFFSRRIGFNAGNRVTGGGKLTGRLGPVKFGVLNTYVDEANDIDARNLLVGRAALNVFGESTLGMIVTRGNPDGSGATNPTRGRAFDEATGTGGGRNSTTVGTDFLYRNTDFRGTGQTFRASLWWAKSIDDDHLSAGRNNGYGIKLEYPNDRINWLVGFEELQEDYAPRLGFVNRNDIRHWFNSFRYRIRPKRGPIRTIDSDVFGQIFVDSGNQLETVNLRIVPAEFTSAIEDGFDVRYRLRHELVRPTDFIPTVSIPADDYTFHEVALRVFTSRNRPIRLEGELGWGTFFDGTRTRFDVDLEFRPSHYLFLGVEYEFRDINLPKRRGLAPGDPDRNDRDTQLVRLKVDLLFTPNIVWSNFIQYDNRSDNAGINSRFRYILRDGREFFVVVNQNVDTDENRANLSRSELLVKGIWTLTF